MVAEDATYGLRKLNVTHIHIYSTPDLVLLDPEPIPIVLSKDLKRNVFNVPEETCKSITVVTGVK